MGNCREQMGEERIANNLKKTRTVEETPKCRKLAKLKDY